jgi:tetratricopeptide (TPR) repeat protein
MLEINNQYAFSEDDNNQFAKALDAFDNQDYDSALIVIQGVIKINPDNFDAYLLLGEILMRQARWDEAIGLYDQLQQIMPDNINVHFYQGLALGEKKQHTLSADCYRRALQIDPQSFVIHYNLATVLMTLKQWQEAEKHFNQALKIQPDFQEAIYNLGVLCQLNDRFEHALNWFLAVIKKDVNHVLAIKNLAFCERNRGNYQKAAEWMQALIRLQPDNALLYYELGVIQLDAELYTNAIDSLVTSIRLDPKSIPSYDNLVRAYVGANNHAAAIEIGSQVLIMKDTLAGKAKVSLLNFFEQNQVQRNKNIIAFSLWGNDPTYTVGAVENVQLASQLYPGWVCRFYCDRSVPFEVTEKLSLLGAEVVFLETWTKNCYERLFWRFFVANDLRVNHFLVRDADSRLNIREAKAVQQWLETGKWFHIMRDDITHTELLLAGMWGGKAGLLPDIKSIAEPYYESSEQRWSDQLFLRNEIWPLIKTNCLVHDGYYNLFQASDYPTTDEISASERVAVGHKLIHFVQQ